MLPASTVRILLVTTVALCGLIRTSGSHAATIQVPGDYATIFEALNAAVSGDVVLVGPGIYSATTTRVYNFTLVNNPGPVTLKSGGFLKSGVTLRSRGGSASTTISIPLVGPHVHCLAIAQEVSSAPTRIQGFTLTKPSGIGSCLLAREMPLDWNLIVEDCKFIDSEGGSEEAGGLMCSAGGNVEVRSCEFHQVSSSAQRGGLQALSWYDQPFTPVGLLDVDQTTFTSCPNRGICSFALETRVTNSEFVNCNTTSDPEGGGAILANFDVEISNCNFSNCHFTPIYVFSGSASQPTFVMRESTFFNCSGFLAGAARVENRHSIIEDCRFEGCTGGWVGALRFGYNGPNDVQIRGNVFRNIATTGAFGAIYSFALAGTVTNNTFVGCSSMGSLAGACIYATASIVEPLAVDHNIFAGTTDGVAVRAGGVSTEACNCYWMNVEGDAVGFTPSVTSIFADPLFCDEAVGDLTLIANSPCAPPGPTGCGLVGAFDVGCGPVSVESMESRSWGAIKGLYR